jgi:AcrR family transcriptional regulator
MPPDERKRAIVEAALPLLREHGKDTTTRQIAEAAGIAEGTIFRVFASKDEILEAAMARVFDPQLFITDLESVDVGLPLRERLLVLTRLFQTRFIDIFTLMTAMAMPKPPRHNHGGDSDEEWRRRTLALVVALLEPDADAFRIPLEDVVRTLRLLTFSGSHPHISEQRLMTPDEIVDVVLHGTLKKDS